MGQFFRPKLFTYSIRPQAFNIHLGSLLLESSFVRDDSFDDLRVEEDDGRHRQDVVADESVEDEALVVPVVGQVVVAARDQETLCKQNR